MQCMTGSSVKASRWALEISDSANVRAAESETPIECHFSERSTPMLTFERPRGLAVGYNIPQ